MLISTSCLHVSLQWEGKSKGFREGGVNAVAGVTELDITKQTHKLVSEELESRTEVSCLPVQYIFSLHQTFDQISMGPEGFSSPVFNHKQFQWGIYIWKIVISYYEIDSWLIKSFSSSSPEHGINETSIFDSWIHRSEKAKKAFYLRRGD